MSDTPTTGRGGAGRGQGRKPLSDTEETKIVTVRLTAAQAAFCKAQGGAAYLRRLIGEQMRKDG